MVIIRMMQFAKIVDYDVRSYHRWCLTFTVHLCFQTAQNVRSKRLTTVSIAFLIRGDTRLQKEDATYSRMRRQLLDNLVDKANFWSCFSILKMLTFLWHPLVESGSWGKDKRGQDRFKKQQREILGHLSTLLKQLFAQKESLPLRWAVNYGEIFASVLKCKMI